MTSLLSALFSHGAIAATWAALAMSLIGIGLLFRRFFTTRDCDALELLTAFWAGFACVLFLLQVWHLVLPVTAMALVVVVALGVVGLARERQLLRNWLGGRPWSGYGVGVMLALALLAWTANRGTGPVAHYDGGMYHIPVVEWSKAYAIVPGLANLHGRLAFNSSSLLYAAMIDHGPWTGRSFHFANSLLLAMFELQVALAWTRLLSTKVRPQSADVFDAVLIIPILAVLVGGEISSLETDIPVAFMLLIAASRLYRSLSDRSGEDDLRRSHFAAVAFLLGAAVCVKLSAVVFAGALFIAALWVFWPELSRARLAMTGAILIPVIMGLVWMLRGVILSGYPAYPATVLGVAVPWRVPTEQASAEAEWIRMSGHDLNHNRIVAGYDWLVPWAKEISSDVRLLCLVTVPLIVSVVTGLIAWSRWRRRPAIAPEERSEWMLLLPVVIGAIFWFFVSPSPRFGIGPMWVGAALTSALWFRTLDDSDAVRRKHIRRVGLFLTSLSLVVVVALATLSESGTTRRRTGSVRALGGLIFLPGSDHGFVPLPKASLVSYTTTSGLQLAVPKDNNLCWRGRLLCTPHPAPNLRLRNSTNIAQGFVVDGGVWLPIRWPNPWTPFLPWLACRRASGAPTPGIARDRACITQTAKALTDTLERVTTPMGGGDPNTPSRAPRPKSGTAPAR
ncbi:MAG: hypothetical protein ABI877_02990 [Gemmatimonadaceae bacterium]